MNNQLKFMFLLSLLLFSCKKEKLIKTLDFEQFTVNVPDNWKSFTKQGYDSKTGEISNGRDKLNYDYGWYSYNFKNETTATHTRMATIIDGKNALIVKPKEKGKGVIGVFIQVDDHYKLSIAGKDIKNEATVLKIFQSVRF